MQHRILKQTLKQKMTLVKNLQNLDKDYRLVNNIVPVLIS
jgi:hypothetical protein